MSTAVAYHEATKYRPATLGEHPGLDWAKQPVPFKRYDCLDPIELGAYLPITPNPFTDGAVGAEAASEATGLALISRWLFFTHGVTATIAAHPRPLHLRAAPSAGGLYPTELYLVAHQAEGIADGLYGYDPQRHRLIPLWPGAEAHAAVVEAGYGSAALAGSDLCLIATGVFERSRWRYRERGYRRVLLDTGHVLGNATLAGHALGRRVHVTSAFCDELLERLLRIDPAASAEDEPSDEGALAIAALLRPGASDRPHWTALPSATGTKDAAPPLTNAVHRAGRLPAQRPRPSPPAETEPNALGGDPLRDAEPTLAALAGDPLATILTRRSTRRYRRDTITRAQLAEVLLVAEDPAVSGCGPASALDRGRLSTFVAVSGVDGIASGVHSLTPGSLTLRPVRRLDDATARNACRFLCLGQDLGGDAAAVVVHTADLGAAVAAMGDRAYRTLHLDAGILGQRLNLAALALGLGASGIGGFFDEQVTDLLGLPRKHAIVYVTTLGIPA